MCSKHEGPATTEAPSARICLRKRPWCATFAQCRSAVKGIARLEGLGGLDKVPWRNSPNSATLATETAGVHTANKHLAPPPRGFSLRAFNALEEPDLSPRGRN
jgi:hypothetical protein